MLYNISLSSKANVWAAQQLDVCQQQSLKQSPNFVSLYYNIELNAVNVKR